MEDQAESRFIPTRKSSATLLGRGGEAKGPFDKLYIWPTNTKNARRGVGKLHLRGVSRLTLGMDQSERFHGIGKPSEGSANPWGDIC